MYIQEKECGNREEGVYYRERVGAYALIVNGNNEIALLKRDSNYFLPGGGVEKNETFEECLLRECAEEIGYNVEIDKYMGKLFHYTESKKSKEFLKLIGHFYTAALVNESQSKRQEDHQLIWCPIYDALEIMQEEFQSYAISEYVRNRQSIMKSLRRVYDKKVEIE